MRKKISILLTLLLILSLAFTVMACVPEETSDPKTEDTVTEEEDNAYFITIEGIYNDPITVTKAEIKEIFETSPVIRGEDNPVYASDKQDDDGNLIPHTLKGVYLDDVLAVYAGGAVSGAFSTMRLWATDGYENLLTAETFSEEMGGHKMIIAFEYDGIAITENNTNGALRAVFPDETANSWARYLKIIAFSATALEKPEAKTLNFLELISDTCNGSFTKAVTTGAGTNNVTFYGVSLDKLFDADILNAEETDKMYLCAYDYISTGTTGYYRDYSGWKSYDYYIDAYLYYTTQVEGSADVVDEVRAPVFDGMNILSGMSVKNVMGLAVSDRAIICLKNAYVKFDEDSDGDADFMDILSIVNMDDEDYSYSVTDSENHTVVISYSDLEDAVLTENSGVYTLNYGDSETLIIKSISIVEED